MEHVMRTMIRLVATALLVGLVGATHAIAQGPPPPPSGPPPGAQSAPPPPPAGPPPGDNSRFSSSELVNTGHRFFGTVSRGLAQVVEKAISQWGLPNGYILGEEAAGAFIAGLRYGEGMLYTKNAGDLKVYWQGPSIGFDAGGEGARTMMLVYNLPNTPAIYERFGGIDGSAYFIGGFGMTALTARNVVLVPIRSGIGLRLGANIGYLKFTPQATWNPL
jgi:hypothetical protein